MLENIQWRIRKNTELGKLFKDVNFTFTKLRCLRRMRRVQRMDDVRNTKKIYEANNTISDPRLDVKMMYIIT
jgi:hypothetical protein